MISDETSIQRATTLSFKEFSKNNCFKNKTKHNITKQNIYVCTVKSIYCHEYVLFFNHFYIISQAVFFCHKSLHCNTIETQSVNNLLLGRRFCRKNVSL